MNKKVHTNNLSDVLSRGVSEVIVKSELIDILKNQSSLRIKMGFDPSSPDLHLGHAVGLRKLRQLQELGHTIVVIVGDWTAQIGDPSGRSSTRPTLTKEEVEKNSETYLNQFFKIVDPENTEIRYQSEWFNDFRLSDIVNLTGRFTVAQFLAREDFNNRMKMNKPIALTEFLYPLLQAYDSVITKADIEIGGVDQKFNLLVGRDLQSMLGQKPQNLIMVPLLVGTDGHHKMSKSLNNAIGLTDHPNDIYGKIMSLSDESIIPYLTTLTDIAFETINEMNNSIKEETTNPMEIKKILAKEIVTNFYSSDKAKHAEIHFEQTIQKKSIPQKTRVFTLSSSLIDEKYRLTNLLVTVSLASSISASKRLLKQGSIKINGQKITENLLVSSIKSQSIIQIGSKNSVELNINHKK